MKAFIASMVAISLLVGPVKAAAPPAARSATFCPAPEGSKTQNFSLFVIIGMALGGAIGAGAGFAIAAAAHAAGAVAAGTIASNAAIGMGSGSAAGVTLAAISNCGK